MTIYGITNCDTVQKALTWFKQHNINYEFHDFKKLGVSDEKLAEWNARAGYERFLNKQGLTWKKLDPEVKEGVKTDKDALPLLKEKTSMIKRPVIEDGDFLFFGFDAKVYAEHFGV